MNARWRWLSRISWTSQTHIQTSPASSSRKNSVPKMSSSQSSVRGPGRGSKSLMTSTCQPAASSSSSSTIAMPSARGVPIERRSMDGAASSTRRVPAQNHRLSHPSAVASRGRDRAEPCLHGVAPSLHGVTPSLG